MADDHNLQGAISFTGGTGRFGDRSGGSGRGGNQGDTGNLIGGPTKDETNVDPDDPAIPSPADLAQAAQRALDDEVAFILLHQDDPDVFAARLDRLLDRLRAAISVKGPHQARAIRTILRIRAWHWMAAYRFDEWGAVINLAYSRARDLKDPELLSEVIERWGIYHSLKQKYGKALHAFEWSAEKLSEGEDEIAALSNNSRRLLLAISRFNSVATDPEMTGDQMLDETGELLVEARELASSYYRAHIYHALARFFLCTKRDGKRAFMYGQLALHHYLLEPEDWGLVAQLLTTLLDALSIDQTGTRVYRQRLLAYLDDILAQHQDFNPWLRAKVLYSHAVQHYHQDNFEQARRYGLQAWWLHWRLDDRLGCATAQHVVGLARRHMGHWQAAERHLSDVLAQYDAAHDAYDYMLAHFSRAMISAAQGDWPRAKERLLETRAEAIARLSQPDQRRRIVEKVDRELETVQRHLAQMQGGAVV